MSNPEADAGVRRTLAQYCHTVDDGRFDEFEACWADDAVVRVQGKEIVGRPAIRAWIERAMGDPEQRGRHLTLNTVIDGEGVEVRAVSDFAFVALRGDGAPRITVTGRYHDTLRQEEGVWVITGRSIELDGQLRTR